jgi:hypothetical protein
VLDIICWPLRGNIAWKRRVYLYKMDRTQHHKFDFFAKKFLPAFGVLTIKISSTADVLGTDYKDFKHGRCTTYSSRSDLTDVI